jgi:prepilin-type N-terminal cleavage/methylation domain-containing protein
MNNVYPPDMIRSPSCHSPNTARLDSCGFTLLEVLMAVIISAGVISVIVPTLMRQVALGEQTNRLTAVEAVVSADFDFFSNYARLWKANTGSYSVNTDITMSSSYNVRGATRYEPTAADCTSGLAAALLADSQKLKNSSSDLRTYLPPYEIKIGDTVSIPVSGGGVSDVNVNRRVDAVGNKIRIFYSLDGANADGLSFTREASLLVEAAAWCDQLP